MPVRFTNAMPGIKRTGPASWHNAKRPVKRLAITGSVRKLNKPTYLTSSVSRVELKAVQNQSYGGIATAPGTCLALGRADDGDEYNMRQGRAIRHVSSDWILRLVKPTSVNTVCVRVIYGVWKQSKDTQNPTATQILDPNSIFSGFEWQAPLNIQESSNMVILYDQLVKLDTPAWQTNTNTNIVSSLNIQKKFKYAAIQEYSGTDHTDVNNWNHFMLLVPDSANIGYYLASQHYFTDA